MTGRVRPCNDRLTRRLPSGFCTSLLAPPASLLKFLLSIRLYSAPFYSELKFILLFSLPFRITVSYRATHCLAFNSSSTFLSSSLLFLGFRTVIRDVIPVSTLSTALSHRKRHREYHVTGSWIPIYSHSMSEPHHQLVRTSWNAQNDSRLVLLLSIADVLFLTSAPLCSFCPGNCEFGWRKPRRTIRVLTRFDVELLHGNAR